ncbi:hypothetical protein [Methylocella sp.]|jgi:hypothetical protein|uniref:hypothetical protein n=1 Tax=Methylocella sp. TaxID=1978226 RepID=UPI003C1C0465
MNKTIIAAVAAFITMGTMLASVEEANAVVCARGVYRAGCAGPHGAVAVRRAPVRRAVIVR